MGWRIEVTHKGKSEVGAVMEVKKQLGIIETTTFLVNFDSGCESAYLKLYRGKGCGIIPKRKGNVAFTLVPANYIALHCIALHCTALHCIAPHCTALHCTVSPTMTSFA